MKRKVAAILCMITLLFCLSGCMQMDGIYEIKDDGSGSAVSVIRYEKEFIDDFATSMGATVNDILGTEDAKLVTVNDIQYYEVREEANFENYAELKRILEESGYEDVYVSEQGVRFIFTTGTSEDELEAVGVGSEDIADALSVYLKITMPDVINMTTGTLSEDGKSAELRIEGGNYCARYDMVVSMDEETTKPAIKGATNKKTYNSARTISASDASGIEYVEYKFKKAGNKKYSSYTAFEGSQTFTNNGTYVVRAYDLYGNKATKTFTIKDTKKPKIEISGSVINGKTYSKESCFVDVSDNCEVKSVKYYVNGKCVKKSLSDVLESGIEVTKVGTHKIIVTDVNGNSRTTTFKVK